MVAASPLFHRDWYLARYPDVRSAGLDPALHYVSHGARGFRDPGPDFDTAWYLSYYSDVAACGMNPLVHYLRYGAKEGRHAHPSQIVLGEVAEAKLSCHKALPVSGEISLFVTHSPDGQLKPHVRHYLSALGGEGIRPVLIVAADSEFREDDTLLDLLDGLYVRQNAGYDFAAWAHVLRAQPQLLRADILYLINDSTIGPLSGRVARTCCGVCARAQPTWSGLPKATSGAGTSRAISWHSSSERLHPRRCTDSLRR